MFLHYEQNDNNYHEAFEAAKRDHTVLMTLTTLTEVLKLTAFVLSVMHFFFAFALVHPTAESRQHFHVSYGGVVIMATQQSFIILYIDSEIMEDVNYYLFMSILNRQLY